MSIIKKEIIPTTTKIKNVFQPRTEFPDYRVVLAQLKGHQTKALNKMTQLAPQINTILELRDARSPISSSNVLIDKIFKNKKKIILYTKKDLSLINSKLLNKWHSKRNEKWISVDCRKDSNIEIILNQLKLNFKNLIPPPPLGLRLMVVGMPNVGKSTLVNGLRKKGLNSRKYSLNPDFKFKNVAKTGNHAGVTRNTSEIIRICSNPEILLYDTPGVLLPQVNNIKTMLSLYLIGTVTSNDGIDPVIAADYLLYMINLNDKTGKHYKKYIKNPTNNIYELLDGIGKLNGNRYKRKIDGKFKTNYTGCAIELINEFQKGRLGKICLDEEVIKELSSEEFNELNDLEIKRVDNMKTRLSFNGNGDDNKDDYNNGKNSDKKHVNKKIERLVKQSNQLFIT